MIRGQPLCTAVRSQSVPGSSRPVLVSRTIKYSAILLMAHVALPVVARDPLTGDRLMDDSPTHPSKCKRLFEISKSVFSRLFHYRFARCFERLAVDDVARVRRRF